MNCSISVNATICLKESRYKTLAQKPPSNDVDSILQGGVNDSGATEAEMVPSAWATGTGWWLSPLKLEENWTKSAYFIVIENNNTLQINSSFHWIMMCVH